MALSSNHSDGRNLSQIFLLLMNNTEEVPIRDLRIIRANSKLEIIEFLISVEANKMSFLTHIADRWHISTMLSFSEEDIDQIDKSKPPTEQDWPEGMIRERLLVFFQRPFLGSTEYSVNAEAVDLRELAEL